MYESAIIVRESWSTHLLLKMWFPVRGESDRVGKQMILISYKVYTEKTYEEDEIDNGELILVHTCTVEVEEFNLEKFEDEKLEEISERLDIDRDYLWFEISMFTRLWDSISTTHPSLAAVHMDARPVFLLFSYFSIELKLNFLDLYFKTKIPAFAGMTIIESASLNISNYSMY